MVNIRTDCRFYRGELPCEKRKVCWDCEEFEEIGKRALILKFGAIGDAIRTTPILSRLRAEGYSEITWICDHVSHEALSLSNNIDRLLSYDASAMGVVLTEEFDTVFSFDKEPEAVALAKLSRSSDKRGFTITDYGRLDIFDENSAYALQLGIDDDLKFSRNTKSVPEIIFDMAGYKFNGEEYELSLPDAPPERVKNRIALNLGTGPRWPTKSWPDENWIELASILKAGGYEPVFHGGPAEADKITNCAAKAGVNGEAPAPLVQFARRLAASGAAVSSDSLGLHVAIAMKTPVVGLFCSTVSAEIEWYGRGSGIESGVGPCYNPRCQNWPVCMNKISPEQVMDLLRTTLETTKS